MDTSPEDSRLADLMHASTNSIDPAVDPRALVSRGRASLRRRRAAAAVAAVPVLAAVYLAGAASGVVGDRGGAESPNGSRWAASTPSGQGAPAQSAQPTACDMVKVTLPEVTRASTPPAHSAGHQADRAYRDRLESYRDVLIGHLDPEKQHLRPVGSNIQVKTDEDCALASLGTKLGWHTSGHAGLAEITVEVSTSWHTSETRLAHDDWRPARTSVLGAQEAYVDGDPVTAVAVTRDDGTTVAIDTYPLFANNSVIPNTDMSFTTEQLLTTAADPGFSLE